MRSAFLVVAIFVTGSIFAQKITIKGQLLDTANTAMPSATVLLLSAKDSSLVNFGVTSSTGFFELKNINRAEYIFKVTYVGYKSITRKVNPTADQTEVDLGILKMETHQQELDAVTIESEKPPVVVKKDTIEFNATSFKTQPNAMVEDLLKELPGVEVDNDGNIDAQGERVQRVTVDGREFFGRDPKIATRNLPADAVDKVQIFDKKSDQAAFTGIDDGQREKTVNLELKEEKRNGAFGNLTGGVGTDDRFNAKATINKFSKTKQFSILGMGNNINEQGFSIDDYMNFTGGAAQMMGGGAMRIQIGGGGGGGNNIPLNFGGRSNGIMTNYAGGINFNNDFSKKTKLTSNYFINYLDHNTIETTNRENLFPDPSRNFTFNQTSRRVNSNLNQRVNLSLDHEIDSANSVKLTTGFSYNETESEQRSVSITNNSESGDPLNDSDQKSSSAGSTLRFNSDLLLRHKFAKKGRTISSNFQFGINDTERDGRLNAINNFYGSRPDQILDQSNSQTTNNISYGGSLSYTEPLGNRKYLEANYSINRNTNDVVRDVFDIEDDVKTKNDTLSNRYNSNYQYQRAGLNLRVNRKDFNFTVGTSMQYTNLNGEIHLSDTMGTIDRTFRNFLPVARFNYDFSSTKHLRFDYETSVQEPSIQQLQPVIDNSDPLNIYVGNPNLRPTYQQSWRVSFNTFNPLTFISFFSFVDVDYNTNAIVNSQSYGNGNVRTTRPVNVDNTMSTRVNTTLSFPINKIKSRINISANYRNSQSISLLEVEGSQIENGVDQNNYGGSFRYNFRYKEILDITLSTQLNYQETKYDFNQADQNYLNQTQTAQGQLTFLKNYQLVADFDYLTYRSQSTGFKQAIPLLNLEISRFILKNKAGELKLGVNNVLDKNLGVTQTASANYFEIQTINSLGRYYMISFTYALNKHLNPMGAMRRGGGGIRIMR